MSLSELLKTTGFTSALIVDDAFDQVPVATDLAKFQRVTGRPPPRPNQVALCWQELSGLLELEAHHYFRQRSIRLVRMNNAQRGSPAPEENHL
jgi:hypothetical protein